jgi:cytochrome o ubiquinol oxidase subunit 3
MEKHNHDDRVFLGFWIYLMTDLIMFAVLFATFIVLRESTISTATIREIFNPPFVLTETLLLLTSSFTCGLGILSLHKKKLNVGVSMFLVTIILGLLFLGMEIYEFYELIIEGNTPQASAFLSSFFSLVGMHGLHISIGIIWLIIMMISLLKKGLTHSNIRKSIMASTFWHFLDVVWIFIFTIVYLFGGII